MDNAISDKLRSKIKARMSFMWEAVTLRELRGWPNDPVHNAAIIYELYGWRFGWRDVELIKAETRARKDQSHGG